MFWGRGSEPPDLTPSTTTCYAPRMKTVWWTLEGLANRDSLVERGRALADTRSAT